LSDLGPSRSRWWTWWICTLLLFASTINYMDRQTLSNASQRITDEFSLNEEQYGDLEWAFGWAFAVGATVFGFTADAVNVRWLYPCVLLAWSAVGMATGLSRDYDDLLLCRTLLGFFEAGHWPCALKTTLRLLEPKDRALGNSVLQSGTAIGAIVTPQIMLLMLTDEIGSWRPVFQIIGGVGIFWVFAWLASIRSRDLAPLPLTDEERRTPSAPFPWRRALVLLAVVVLINASWHLFRVWLPKFMIKGRGYSEPQMFYINTFFNIFTDIGCLGAGAMTAVLFRWNFSVHQSRVAVFSGCAGLAALSAWFPWLPRGPALMAVLMLIGAGLLGLFPCYYSFSQELSKEHPGKVMGMLGTVAWLTSAPTHKFFGQYLDRQGSFDVGMAVAGLLPLGAVTLLIVGWGKDRETVDHVADTRTKGACRQVAARHGRGSDASE
jgi:ACS family hexuronate transporter-like MFS transporter